MATWSTGFSARWRCGGGIGPVDLGGSKPRTLLALLIARANEAVSADWLIDELWGEHPPPTAAGALQTYVWHLRRSLEPERGREPPRVLVTHGAGYVLRVDQIHIDAHRFEGLAASGREALRSDRSEDAAVALRDALALWHGRAFAEFYDQDVLRAEGERLEDLRLGVAEDLMAADLALGREVEVATHAERLLRDYPLRERLWARLMLARYRMGRQAEALRAYRDARRILGEELGIEPSTELRSLEEAVLLHDPRLEGAPPPPPPPVPRLFPSVLAGAGGRRLVGRRAELRRLSALWEEARGGHRRIVFLGGEPGIGKTSLAAVWSHLAHEEGATVLIGRCTEEAAIPYLPFIEVIRQVLDPATAAVARRLPPGQAAELARLVPDHIERPAHRLRAEPGTERYLLYEAVAS
ncbi:MAG: BTAD domain-containing putative transcriptional regulator, partial [Acidimicrobiales bacterium]